MQVDVVAARTGEVRDRAFVLIDVFRSFASTLTSLVVPLVPLTTASNFVLSGTGLPPRSREKSGVSVVPLAEISVRCPAYLPTDDSGRRCR